MIVFTIGGKSAFEVPVSEVQQTDKDARKTEISLMFPAPPGNVCASSCTQFALDGEWLKVDNQVLRYFSIIKYPIHVCH